jgi:hypothetical protein
MPGAAPRHARPPAARRLGQPFDAGEQQRHGSGRYLLTRIHPSSRNQHRNDSSQIFLHNPYFEPATAPEHQRVRVRLFAAPTALGEGAGPALGRPLCSAWPAPPAQGLPTVRTDQAALVGLTLLVGRAIAALTPVPMVKGTTGSATVPLRTAGMYQEGSCWLSTTKRPVRCAQRLARGGERHDVIGIKSAGNRY